MFIDSAGPRAKKASSRTIATTESPDLIFSNTNTNRRKVTNDVNINTFGGKFSKREFQGDKGFNTFQVPTLSTMLSLIYHYFYQPELFFRTLKYNYLATSSLGGIMMMLYILVVILTLT